MDGTGDPSQEGAVAVAAGLSAGGLLRLERRLLCRVGDAGSAREVQLRQRIATALQGISQVSWRPLQACCVLLRVKADVLLVQ